jgi:hypothetical protein
MDFAEKSFLPVYQKRSWYLIRSRFVYFRAFLQVFFIYADKIGKLLN